jgi:hypothetical protein
MNAVWLLRYISSVCVLLALIASVVSYHPDIQAFGRALPPAFIGVALLSFGVAALLRRLSPSHWVHRSKPVQCALFAVAVTVTLLLVVVG